MDEKTNAKIQATIAMPDPFLGAHYETYMRVSREQGEVVVVNARYLMALAVLERAEVVIEGKSYDLAGLKKLGLDAPLSVISWVAATVQTHVDDQFAIAKNSSEPPSKPPTTTAEKTEPGG